MEVMILLVICSFLAALGFLIAFIWALRKGQFDDMVTPSIRMLFESKRDEDINESQGRVG